MIRAASLLAFSAAVVVSALAFAGSETPPAGPPWTKDFAAAQTKAIEEGKPLFVYMTKTYCPHCVKMEKELLCKPELAPAYPRASWMYVFRDFSGSDEDRAAELVAIRLGLTSYPQHLLLDPATLEVLADTGRQLDSFNGALDRVKVKAGGSLDPVKKLAAANARANALQASKSAEKAKKALDDEDLAVKVRALEILAAEDPAAVAPKAAELLAVPNDPFRYAVCQALAKAKEPKAARPLEDLLKNVPASHNPNVLRMEAAKALAGCGDAASVAALRPFAEAADARNGLTGTAVDAIAAVAARDAKAKPAAKDALAASYPAPAADAADAKLVESLAKRVHAALSAVTGRKPDFPSKYDDAAVKKLRAAW